MVSRTGFSRGAGLLVATLVGGCYDGTDLDAGGGTDDGGPGSDAGDDSSGDPDGPVEPVEEDELGPSGLRQLSPWEYRNTIRDLFGPDVADEAATVIASLPVAGPDVDFSTMDRAVTSAHVDAQYNAAVTIAGLVAADPQRRARLDPCFEAPGDEQVCAESFTTGFGRRVFRRPVTDEERVRILEAYFAVEAETLQERVENALLFMLMSPAFVYRPEVAGESSGDQVLRLTPFEQATRLSYLLWGSTPDDALLDAAEAGELGPQRLREHAERLLDDPRARQGMARFFDEWLELGERPGLSFSDAYLDGLSTEGLRDDMLTELPRLAEHLVFDAEGQFADLLDTRLSFVTTPGLAEIYGVALPGDPSEPVELPVERSGVLTRASLLLGTGEETHPVVRGAFIARRLLCIDLELPPPDQVNPEDILPPPFDPTKTSRERWEEKTSAATCMGCHAVINPLGFAAEGYDSIGRPRSEEVVVDPITGETVATHPIDTHSELLVDGELVDVADLVDVGGALAGSDGATRCFAQQFFRYGYGRREVSEDDAAVEDLATSLTEQSLREVVLGFVSAPEFSHVKVKE